jgi:hypothetical protein
MPERELARAVLSEDDPLVAGALAWAVLHLGGPAVEQVLLGLNSEDVAIRRRAIRVVVRDAGSTQQLVQALNDEDTEVRELAALELGRRRVGASCSSLFTMVKSGRRDVESAEILAAVEEWSADFIEWAEHELHTLEVEHPARARITQALAEFPGAAELLTSLTTDRNHEVSLTARAILSSLAQ